MNLENGQASDQKSHVTQKPTTFLSRIFFCWTVPIIWRGYKREVTQEDICPTLQEHSTNELGRRISDLWKMELCLSKPSLYRALARAFGFEYGLTFMFLVIQQCILRTSLPLLLGILIRYKKGIYSDDVGYLTAAVFVIFTFLSTVIYSKCSYILDTMGMRIRISIVSLIYEKALRLSQAALVETGVGQLTNIISNDVNRFDRVMIHTPYIVACPMQLVFAGVVLWWYTGPTCLVGIFFLILVIPLTVISNYSGKLRAKLAVRTDRRIRLVSEILNGMLLLKMCMWEEPYRRKMVEVRSDETKLIIKRSKLLAFTYSLFEVASKMSIFLTFLTYVLLGLTLSSETVFVTLAMYNIIMTTSATYFPVGIQGYSEIVVAISRIQMFLLREEKQDGAVQFTPAPNPPISETGKIIGVKLMNLSASWPKSDHSTLTNISMTVNPGDLLGVLGPVGSGKSTLLQAILGESPRTDGSVLVKGTVAYASQEPCLFAGSIRDNILFGQPFLPLWYADVLEACALSRDLALILHGDETLVGDKGINLSGGQRTRISLARAVYSRADILLLDDPLSSVDVRVARHLMDKCIRGLLREKCVILVTHQTHYLKEATYVISLVNGAIVSRGSYDQVCGANEVDDVSTFPTTIDDIYVEDTDDSRTLFREPTTESDRTFSRQSESEENLGLGLIPLALYVNYFRTGNSRVYLSFIAVLIVLSQAISNGSDLWLKEWTDYEQLEADGSNSTFSGHVWSEDRISYLYLGIYAGQAVLLLLVAVVRSVNLFNSSIKSAQTLHARLFSAILRAPMRFFQVNSIGRVLNRFSNDMGIMDEYLPTLVFAITVALSQVFGALIVVTIMSPVLVIPTLVLLVLLYFLRRFYVSAAAKCKRLEGTSRSPVFAHFNTTLSSISVIRAQRAQDMFRIQFNSYQDTHTANYFAYVSASRWVQSTAELVADMYISCVLIYFTLLSSSATALGLAISTAFVLTQDVKASVAYSAEIVNQIVSVERVMEYTNVEPEAPLRIPGLQLGPRWVEQGDIKIDQVSAAYENGAEVLQDINLQIRAGEKIGIVGRTGAGKSSLIATLFRIVEPRSGKIYINNVDICEIGLHDLRSQLAIIPQTPMLFSGTIRENLDPFYEFLDSELWNALEAVQLERRILHSSGQNLNATVSEGGSNFSHGEKQLICLARTILRKSKILILDEATANIDTITDRIIQETLRKRFTSSTVLTIAHRLDTVMGSDRVLLLDAGRILEFDKPANLVQNQQSCLHRLLINTGPANYEMLKSLAIQGGRRTLGST